MIREINTECVQIIYAHNTQKESGGHVIELNLQNKPNCNRWSPCSLIYAHNDDTADLVVSRCRKEGGETLRANWVIDNVAEIRLDIKYWSSRKVQPTIGTILSLNDLMAIDWSNRGLIRVGYHTNKLMCKFCILCRDCTLEKKRSEHTRTLWMIVHTLTEIVGLNASVCLVLDLALVYMRETCVCVDHV